MEDSPHSKAEQQQFLLIEDRFRGTLIEHGVNPALFDNYEFTPLAYNIGLGDDGEPKGFDLTDTITKQRIYITNPSELACERAIRYLGTNRRMAELKNRDIVPERLEQFGPNKGLQSYLIPEGSQLFTKAFPKRRTDDPLVQSINKTINSIYLKLLSSNQFAYDVKKSDFVVVIPDNVDELHYAKELGLFIRPPYRISGSKNRPRFLSPSVAELDTSPREQ
ncbi:MAG: hypothetical protein ACREF7_01325 [Candidatus Saccharimonadales bacterium]